MNEPKIIGIRKVGTHVCEAHLEDKTALLPSCGCWTQWEIEHEA